MTPGITGRAGLGRARATIATIVAAAALATAGCTASSSLPTLRPLPSAAATDGAAGAPAAGAAAAATPAATAPNPLGPGLGLPSPGASLPTPIINDPAEMAPPLWLTDTEGQLFDYHRYAGTPILLYFGYTNCPDVCPASLGVLRETVAKSDVPVQVVFVTVDPDRDTPDKLKEYLDFFGQGWIGLTGRNSQILQAAELYGARYQKLDTQSASGYAVGHTTDIYLIDTMGMWVETFPFGSSADQIVPELRRIAGA
jgi:protein SCO1/2